MVPDRAFTQQDIGAGSSGSLGDSSLEGSNLVPSSSGDAERLSTTHTYSGVPTTEKGGTKSSAPQLATWPVSGRDIVTATFPQRF